MINLGKTKVKLIIDTILINNLLQELQCIQLKLTQVRKHNFDQQPINRNRMNSIQ